MELENSSSSNPSGPLTPLQADQSLPVEIQPFTLVNEYTTFSVEYTEKGERDVHFHFFETPESKARGKEYWKVTFAHCLDKIARAHFGFEYPRIQASLIEGVLRCGQDPAEVPQDSWWMLVQQIEVPDVNLLVTQFLELLDQALDSSSLK